jgi:HK97 family phage prohead protease
MAKDPKKPYGDVTYADPGYQKDGQKRYPLDTEAHCRAAWSYINQEKNASQYTAEQLSAIKGRIKAALKKYGVDVTDNSGSGRSEHGMEIERRFTPVAVELRATPDAKRIGGYAAVFGKLSKNLGGFVETVEGGAFNQSRSLGWPGVVARYNHDTNMLLGTTAGRTLDLRVDDQAGLWYEVTPPSARGDILELVQRGDVQHSSFAFRVMADGDSWATSDQGYPLRSLHGVQLVDVAPVVDPAYPDATAAARAMSAAYVSLAEHVHADIDEVRSMAEADELRRFFVRTDQGAGVPPKPRLFGPSAATALLARRRDPWS